MAVSRKDLHNALDQCVRCGLCSASCPTYGLLREEGDSPRGRIALIQGFVEAQLSPSKTLRQHLDNCLGCRACESVCPSLVPFGEILEEARGRLLEEAPLRQHLGRRLLVELFSSGAGVRVLPSIRTAYRFFRLSWLLHRLAVRWPLLGALDRLAGLPLRLPQLPAPDPHAQIHLFTGCIGRAAQADALEAAVFVLRRLGYGIACSPMGHCCGALHRHNGLLRQADQHLTHIAQTDGQQMLVGLASACVAELGRDPRLNAQELCRFLADLPQPLPLRPFSGRVAIHVPCSQRNALSDARAAADLLSRIPQLQPLALPENDRCCGAAGTYLLRRPRLSQALLQPKLDALARLAPDILVTTNPGCALHFAAGIRERGLGIPVLHPIELIARQLSTELPEP